MLADHFGAFSGICATFRAFAQYTAEFHVKIMLTDHFGAFPEICGGDK